MPLLPFLLGQVQQANQPAPQVDPLQTMLMDQIKQQQLVAQGKVPSLAEAQARQQGEQALAQSLAIARSRGGANAGAASRQVQNVATAQGQQIDQNAVNARLAEQQAAQQSLLGALSGFQQQRMQNQASADAATKQQQGQIGGGLLGGLAGLATLFSDENAKKNIKSGTKDMSKFLDTLTNYSYEYKNKLKGDSRAAEGKRFGPMAQEIEATEVGKSLVKTDKATGMKTVDFGGLLMASLAANADLHNRIKKIEKK